MRRLWNFVLAAVLTLPTPARAGPLSLVEVLKSAERAHPNMEVADATVEEARGSVQEARGAFDLQLYAEAGHAPLGKYDKSAGAIGAKQPTALSGLQLWTRYENGADFAPYDGGRVTSEAGEASLGLLFPLLQGRSIDKARLQKAVSRLGVELAEQERRQARASLFSEAASSWWKWVIVGQKLEVYRQLVAQAEQRRKFLEEQVTAGAAPEVELFDNLRVLSQRRAALAVLELEFRQRSLALGLFLRDEQNSPRPPRGEELPQLPVVGAIGQVDRRTFQKEVEDSPAMRIYDFSLRIVDRELEWAKNRRLPRLDLEAYAARSFGAPRAYSALDESVTETTAGGKLKLSWEPQMRAARGKAAMLRAKKRQLESKRRLLSDKLSLSLEAQLAALTSQFEVAKLSRDATEQAERVSEAERQSFEMGQSSVLSVNLREQAALSTYITELDAILEFQTAWVKLQELLGSDEIADYLPPREALPEQPGAKSGEGIR